ncbi:hypothetical protein Nepgr_004395 [Nepenthes gracilis]|uniref:Uncharacterized protein n=1 Tax=Nepenthes gracilis TaxID=150966 RepID=A0AAD3S1M8_NEPGR|nr:hypothetical protein Nepgr_004395 [Nepenthes gracilis]
MLMMPGGIERHFDGADNSNFGQSPFSNGTTQMVVHVSKSSTSPQKESLKFLIYGRTGWTGGFLGQFVRNEVFHMGKEGV